MNNEKVNPKLSKEEAEFLLEYARRLRNCKKIEYKIYQFQKQLYLGHSSMYNFIMNRLYPNYDEHKKSVQQKQSGQPLENNKKLSEIEKEIK